MSLEKSIRSIGPRLNLETGLIDMTHGSGGKNSYQLVKELFSEVFGSAHLMDKNNYLKVPVGDLVMTTDSFVVSPLFFPGGDIGSLSMHGTINDLAMCGAQPLYLTISFIIEEGFPLKDLLRISQSLKKTQEDTGIKIQSGDTKVVERGKGDGVFITTTGVGILPPSRQPLSLQAIKPKDVILVNGPLGDHGIAILAHRAHLDFETQIQSDSAALHTLTEQMLTKCSGIRYLQDPTRGGLSGCLNEISYATGLSIELDSKKIPLRTEVRAACELLGIDPLVLANEGKLVAICSADCAEDLLREMKTHSLGQNAAIIGTVVESVESQIPRVTLRTPYGGQKILNWLSGDQLPRIC